MAEVATEAATGATKGQEGSTQTESAITEVEKALQVTLQRQKEQQEEMQQRLLEQTDDAKVLDERLKIIDRELSNLLLRLIKEIVCTSPNAHKLTTDI